MTSLARATRQLVFRILRALALALGQDLVSWDFIKDRPRGGWGRGGGDWGILCIEYLSIKHNLQEFSEIQRD